MIVDYKLSEPFNYYNDYEFSIKEPSSFWGEVAKKYCDWDKPFNTVYNYNSDTKKSEWFKGGLVNTCFNALDKNILNGKGDQVAFIHEIPIKKLQFKITYKELYERVCIFSRALKNLGVSKGDVVVIYMHNSFETIISMLSCARIGAVHNVVYNGTLPDFLSNCINETKPKVLISSNFGLFHDESPHYYLPLLKEALHKSTFKPNHIIIYNRNDIIEGIDYKDSRLSNDQIENSIDWDKLIKNLEPLYEYTPVESQHPVYINYSSGTTNKPKGIIRETGGHIVVLNYVMRNSYQMNEGDIMFLGTPFGWISAHSILIYGTLFANSSAVFSEGPIKDPSNEIWDIVSRNRVKSFFITPLFIRRIRILDPDAKNTSKYDLSSVKSILISGEKVHLSLLEYLKKLIDVPALIEYGTTETGWCMTGHSGLQVPIKGDASLGKPVTGFNIKIVNHLETHSNKDKKTIELKPNEIGEIAIKLPLPPCCAVNLFNDDKDSTSYNSNYLNKYPGYYITGDLGYYDSNGYFHIIGRSGDSITVGNHSINTGIIENDILSKIPSINECCIIGINHNILSSIPGVFYTLKQDTNETNNVNDQLLLSIKNQIELFFYNLLQTNSKFRPIIIKLKNIPKNKTGKTVRSIIKSIFNGEENFQIPSLENESVISELLEEYSKLKLIQQREE